MCSLFRHKVKELIDFIQDDDKLREERKKAKKNKDKYVGMSSDAMGMHGLGKLKPLLCYLVIVSLYANLILHV